MWGRVGRRWRPTRGDGEKKNWGAAGAPNDFKSLTRAVTPTSLYIKASIEYFNEKIYDFNGIKFRVKVVKKNISELFNNWFIIYLSFKQGF